MLRQTFVRIWKEERNNSISPFRSAPDFEADLAQLHYERTVMNDTPQADPIRSQCPARGLKRQSAILNALSNDYSDDFVDPDHPAFVSAEMAYRRGFTQALAEFCIHAKDVPDDVRFWIKEYFDRCWEWRNEFRSGKRKEFYEPPPESHSFPIRK